MKKLEYLLLSLSILLTPSTKVLALDATPYAFAYQLPVYGYCAGNTIYVDYEGVVTMSGRLADRGAFLDHEAPNASTNTVVVYRYTDTYGNLYIPYYSGNQNYLNTLVELPSPHGACPV